MAETYPTTLPLPDHGSYVGSVDQGLIRTSVPSPAPSQIKGFNSPTTTITMTFSMDNDTYTTWIAWITANGWNWFNMPVVSPSTPVDITSTHRVRIISDVEYTKRGDNWLSVTVTAEMIPGDEEDPNVPPVRVYDFAIAGTVLAPSPDYIQAGTPASPSPDLMSGNIYYYTEV